ncbi:MAG TPA: MarR family winged helix-turn-helix transcriptional regulator [Acidimicrobiales bacterium]|nr:MarR family winged helix-turn-helix transcriptional regulator [Acidimicrobiales bacterium]
MTTPAEPRELEAVRAVARLSRALERSTDELSLAHYRVLSAVASGDERASRVAKRLALGKPTVSASVDALCRRGLLERSGVAGDQRAAALELTADGAEVLGRVERAMTGRLEELCAATPEPVLVARALGWLGEALDGAAARRAGDAP